MLLCLAGAALGLLIAKWGVEMTGTECPRRSTVHPGMEGDSLDGRALAFTLTAAVAAGILSGLAPAWQCSRPNLTDSLKEGGRGSSVGRGRHRLRNILVTAEISMAVVLLVGASLMVRGFKNMVDTGTRLEPATLLEMRLALTDSKYHENFQRTGFYQNVLARIGALPGVRGAAVVSAMPYSDHGGGRYFTIEGQPQDASMYRAACTR